MHNLKYIFDLKSSFHRMSSGTWFRVNLSSTTADDVQSHLSDFQNFA